MNAYQNAFGNFKNGFFGSCALAIMVQSCIGGIAAMAILGHGAGPWQLAQLLVVVGACITFNGSVLSVQKPRTIFNLLIAASTVCTLLAVLNFAL